MMKKLVILSALVLFAITAIGQTLKKGNLIGTHVLTVTLKPDVTMDQYLDLFAEKFIPEYEKHFKGAKLFLMKGIRGVNKNEYGLLYHFESEEVRDKYINDDESLTEDGKAAREKLTPVIEELKALEETWNTKYTDWVIR